MISSQLRSAISPQDAITRAERRYQAATVKKPRAWRRWFNRTVTWLMIVLSLIHIGGLLVASLTLRDPTTILRALEPLPVLLIVFAIFYHLYLLFQTISLSANSISREKEAQTWDLLVLTGINARQIVRGKWWATVQQQFRSYLLLTVFRAGATAAFAISLVSTTYYFLYDGRMQLPHTFTIVMVVIFGTLFTLANLGFSAACGMMGSAASRRSPVAIIRGLAAQLFIPLLPLITFAFIFSRPFFRLQSNFVNSAYQAVLWVSFSTLENGFTLLSAPASVSYQYYNLEGFTPLAPIRFDWMGLALVALGGYALFIWITLRRAERLTVKALAMPVK